MRSSTAIVADEPPEVAAEILDINRVARDRALQAALLIPLLASVIGFVNGFRMVKLPTIDAAPTGPRASTGGERSRRSGASRPPRRFRSSWSVFTAPGAPAADPRRGDRAPPGPHGGRPPRHPWRCGGSPSRRRSGRPWRSSMIYGALSHHFFAGLLERVVSAERHGHRHPTLGEVVRNLPWHRLVVADLILTTPPRRSASRCSSSPGWSWPPGSPSRCRSSTSRTAGCSMRSGAASSSSAAGRGPWRRSPSGPS